MVESYPHFELSRYYNEPPHCLLYSVIVQLHVLQKLTPYVKSPLQNIPAAGRYCRDATLRKAHTGHNLTRYRFVACLTDKQHPSMEEIVHLPSVSG